jgi:acyl-CoA synthetase (NDP forming)
MSTDVLDEIFHAQSIAVVGASSSPASGGYHFTRHLLDYDYQGKIYPVNPNYSEIFGIKAYPSVRDIPDSVDFVISSVPASQVLSMLDDCSRKGVRAVHLFTARFSETGRKEAAELEQEILKKARSKGIRLIGPNCMGVYCPRQRISFGYEFPREAGSVGVVFQSGGAATELVRLAAQRGIRFSKVVSYGNALDLNECDYLDYFSWDPETKIVIMYIEGLKDGRRFLKSLRRAASIKPVIIVKGGRGQSGARAIFSHTASLAGSMQIWEAAINQAGAVSAESFEELIDLAVSFYFLPPIRGPRVGVVGGGGGMSVRSADECEEAGLEVIPLPPEIREELKNMGNQIWDWIGNPTDASITGGFGFSHIDMLQMMANNPNFDLLIGNVSEGAPMRKEEMVDRLRAESAGYVMIGKSSSKPLLVVIGDKSPGFDDYDFWRWKELSQTRTELIEAGIPFYPGIGRAARSAGKLLDYYRKRK